MKKTLSDDQSNFWSLVLEISKFCALLTGGLIALWQYSNTARRQFETPVWEKQLQLYFAASDTAAQIAYLPVSDQKWRDARTSFWTLYNGSLCIVEDRNVESAMVVFSKTLSDLEGVLGEIDLSKTHPEKSRALEDGVLKIQMKLRSLSLKISYACRSSLGDRLSGALPTVDKLRLK